jgi:hypothetical protein
MSLLLSSIDAIQIPPFNNHLFATRLVDQAASGKAGR